MSREYVAGAPVISEDTQRALTEKQLLDFRGHKRDLLRWLSAFEKDPEKAEGYSDSTIEQLTYQLEAFYRWVWDQEGQYTTQVTSDHADEYMKEIAHGDTTNGHKATVKKYLKRLFKYRRHELGEEVEWGPDYSFSEPHNQPNDYLTAEERRPSVKRRWSMDRFQFTTHYRQRNATIGNAISLNGSTNHRPRSDPRRMSLGPSRAVSPTN